MMLTKRMVTIFAAMCLIISINGIAAPSEDYDTSTTETVTPTENANPQEGSKSSGGGAGGTVMLPAVFEGEITLTADGESGALGSEITLTASVEAGDFDGDAEIIFFVNQNEEIGRKVFDGNDCSMEYTPAQVGEQLFHAEFLIDGEVKAQSENVTYTVEKANNSVTLTISKTTINEGESVTLYAQLQHPIEGGAVFQNGKEKIKTAFFDAVGKAQTTLSELPPGSHSISAVYEGDENYKKSASKPVTLTVLSIDNDLSNIKLSDGRISFDKDKTLYSVDFKDTVNYIKVTPIASHDEATIYVTAYRFSQQLKSGEQSGRIYLDEGRNADINIIVTAQSGDEKVYTISAYREKSKTNSVRGPTIRYRFDRTDAASEITFVDTAFHWAESVVYTLAKDGVLTGETNGGRYYFHPERQITRTEFAVMLSRAMSLDVAHTRYVSLPFDDESFIPEWGAEHIKAVYFNGWMGGDGINFNPHSAITRAEAMTAVARACGTYGNDLYFNDSAQVPSWASAAISGLVRSDIVSGYGDGTIRPLNSVNRAEAAQMLYKLIY